MSKHSTSGSKKKAIAVAAAKFAFPKKYDAALKALAAAKDVEDVMKVRVTGETMRAFARMMNDRHLEIDAVEIWIRAERVLGQMLAQQKITVGLAKGGGDKRSNQRVVRRPGDNLSYQEIGINKYLADRARKLARLSQKDFTKQLTVWRASGALDLNTIYEVAQEQHLTDGMKKRTADAIRERRPLIDMDLVSSEDEEGEPSEDHSTTFRNCREYLEWLLQVNPSSSKLPKTIRDMRKVVAHGVAGLFECLTWGADEARKYFVIVSAMEERINRLERETKEWLLDQAKKTRASSA